MAIIFYLSFALSRAEEPAGQQFASGLACFKFSHLCIPTV